MEPYKVTSMVMPVRTWEKGHEVQQLYGDVSMSQVLRKALDLGLDQLRREAKAALKLDGEPRR